MVGATSVPCDAEGIPGLFGDPTCAGGASSGLAGTWGRRGSMGQIQLGAVLLHWQMGLDLALDTVSSGPSRGGCSSTMGQTPTRPPRPDSVLLGSSLIEARGLHPTQLSVTSLSLPGASLSWDAGAGHEPGCKPGPPTSSKSPPGPHRDPHLPVSPAPGMGNGHLTVPPADCFVSPKP